MEEDGGVETLTGWALGRRGSEMLSPCAVVIPGEVRISKRPCPRSLSPMRTGSDSKSVNVKASYLSAQAPWRRRGLAGEWEKGRGTGSHRCPKKGRGAWNIQGTMSPLSGSLNPTQIMRRVSSLPREKGRWGQSQDSLSTPVSSKHHSAQSHPSPIPPSAFCLSPHGDASS